MNANTITAQPLQRPHYLPTIGLTCEAWIYANSEDLEEWYLACGGEDDHIVSPADFLNFCETQYELTRDDDETMKEAFAEAARDNDAYERLRGEQIDAEDAP
jgi:hypothetical protein